MQGSEHHDLGCRRQAGRDVRVVTVDDQPLFLDVARLLVDVTPGFAAVGEASSGEEALELVRAVEPDLVLVDVRMAGLGGIETARRLHAEHGATAVVLVSSDDLDAIAPAAEGSGATALVRKQDLDSAMLRRLWATHVHGATQGPPPRRP